MSNFYHLKYCKKCIQMTNHVFMDDTPKQHQYTAECLKCGHRPIQGEDASSVIAGLEREDENK
jgi:hypothetical protein